MAKARKLLEGAKSLLDDALTPSKLKESQATARRKLRDKQQKRTKAREAAEARENPTNPATRLAQRESAKAERAAAEKATKSQASRQKTARKKAVTQRKRAIAKGAGAAGAAGAVGAGAAAATGASSTAKTRSQTAGKRGTIKKERIGSGRSMYMLDGRLNISKENLKDSGMTLTEYANYMQKNKKRPPKAQKKMGGGMMKSKMASKGGAKGGKRMPPGMKKGGPASKFPDLSGDGKVTQKDILMGKGVIGGRGLPKKPAKPKAGGRSSDAIKKARTAKMDEMKDRLKDSKMGRAKMKSKGGTIKKPGGMQAGGMMKSKMSSKGGAKGGRMPGGMKNGGMAKKTKKGYALGGMAKKGMAKGGAMTKKGMAKGGTNKKRAVSRKPRGVGAALRGFGKAMKK